MLVVGTAKIRCLLGLMSRRRVDRTRWRGPRSHSRMLRLSGVRLLCVRGLRGRIGLHLGCYRRLLRIVVARRLSIRRLISGLLRRISCRLGRLWIWLRLLLLRLLALGRSRPSTRILIG